MINPAQKIDPHVYDTDALAAVAIRDGFGHGLVEAAENDDRIVGLCADLAESTRMHWFREKFPDRYVEIGVAEQNLAVVASGMANYGKIPFITSYAAFSPGRNNEQIRTTISLNNVPVKIIGSHAGISVGPDGATHQALEDIALMRAQPNMTVIVPADANEAYKATVAMAHTGKPAYLRLGREKTPVFTTDETPFEIGRAEMLYDSDDSIIGIIACGALVHNALRAADELANEGIAVSVMNCHTIKPLDTDAVIHLAKRTQGLVTVEEHQIHGGLGSAIAECTSNQHPTLIEYIGVHDEFGQSGTPDELIAHYHMDVESIKDAVKKLIDRA